MLNYDDNNKIKNYVCIHDCSCDLNIYGQCIYAFNLQCRKCKYGLKNIYDKCKNKNCSLYLQNITISTLENDTIEVEEDFLKEYISEEDFEKYTKYEKTLNTKT
jgi:hypothetical protein